MSGCGCGCSSLITSTQGPKGDTGPAGGTYLERDYTSYSALGTDIYNGGSGLVLAVEADATHLAGTLSYQGQLYVESTDVGQVTITPLKAGVAEDTRITKATYPAASAGKSNLAIPVGGSIALGAGEAFSLRVLGTTGINAKLIRADIKYFYK
jgi:hypothetical protein